MRILLITLLTYLIGTSTFAGEFTGAGSAVGRILKSSGITQQSLNAQGLTVKRVNNRVHLNDIHSIVTNKNVVRYHNINHVEFKNPSAAATLGDVIHFELGRGTIPKGQIRAVIVK